MKHFQRILLLVCFIIFITAHFSLNTNYDFYIVVFLFWIADNTLSLKNK